MWGNKKSREVFQLPIVKHQIGDFDTAEDDERRLLFVAITRAKNRVVLTDSEQSSEGKEQITSRFLSRIDSTLLTLGDATHFIKSFSPVQDLKTLSPLPITKDILIEALTARGFSPTAFNNYLKSPWEYFFRNVLQVPQIKTPNLQLGSAVHGVLDTLVRQFASDPIECNLARVSDLLKQQLSKEAITDKEFARLHEQGLNMLVLYVPYLYHQDIKDSSSEVTITATLETGLAEYPHLKLNGKLDRVDYNEGSIIRVVDYKTGKPKTRGQIEGTTADSDGEYKRQLTFYALLLSLQDDVTQHCRTGVISFVEPDTKGKIREEVFTITDEEIAALKGDLVSAVKEIVTGTALRTACDPNVCHYCDLVSRWQQ
jgi:ATP-dependent exoDNAse (exonuclease V) beta subunit